VCMAYGIPLLSGKDSMYVDGHLDGPYGETRKISALETLQFSATGLVDDILKCVTMDSKVEGDLVYILGKTSNELGGSEYYDHLGFIGANVPEVKPIEFAELYMALSEAIKEELVASSHGIYRGGLGIHLAMVSMGGNRGMNVSLDSVPVDRIDRNDTLLFSESAGRFIVTIDPENRNRFEEKFKKLPFALIGEITGESEPLIIEGKGDEKPIVSIPVKDLKEAWKNPFGDLI